ncbi:UDP-N-acetylglucosamine-transferase [Limnobacter parvus]|uniref:UDP-N-acetylglucosamine-transferase n=1 Tax=Limnobacter parvus TaxID=2939690 RepID=A0ABT1XH39_9BURK|nr:UDP-N-acetylglucosamine-transferase [Limnobacter parvus]MCR2745577.1 UDP-N-acetylglucosamine-transferase [Limnobacter parvus]
MNQQSPPTIFVSVVAFCEPHLYLTVHQLFAKATHPERIFVGLVDQSDNLNPQWLADFPARKNINYVGLSPIDSRGVCWARSIAFSLYNDQDYLLQIDSHTLFDQGWDESLIQQHQQLKHTHPKPLISTYPPGFRFDAQGRALADEPIKSNDIFRIDRNLDSKLTADRAVLQFKVFREPAESEQTQHLPGFHVAACFLFTTGNFTQQVPYDPYLYFRGEEQSLSLRAHAKGYQVFHPRHNLIPVYHLYKEVGKLYEGQHWRPDLEAKRQSAFGWLQQRSNERIHALFTPGSNLGVYGIDDPAHLESFCKLSKIDYLGRT